MRGMIRAMLNFFSGSSYRRREPVPLPVRVGPDREILRSELEAAKKANATAGMSVVLTATQSRREESRIQAMYRGMLKEMDKDRPDDE